MNPQMISASPASVLVNASTLNTGVIIKNKEALTNINLWHKFTVINTASYNRNEVLGAILDYLHPLDLIPVAYWKGKSESCFFARNCGSAIQKLCDDKLVVPNPMSSIPFKIIIQLKYTTTSEFKIDVQKNIIQVLNKRYNTGTVDLDRFHEDSDLVEFCPLSQPKIMFFVIHLTKSLSPFPRNFILTNNRIKLLNPLSPLEALEINTLDLRNNLLSSLKTLEPLRRIKAKSIFLDGNPFCNNLNKNEYRASVRDIMKNIDELDGVPMKAGTFPATRRNFLCNINAVDFVDRFLEHYFTIFDTNRKSIYELYHSNAMFSLNSTHHKGQLSSTAAIIGSYNKLNRNLVQLTNSGYADKQMFVGNHQIAEVLLRLPPSEHDPYSFLVDLMHFDTKYAIITVCGVFRKQFQTGLNDLYGFRRTFVIEKLLTMGFITNDVLHVHNAFSWQIAKAFNVLKPLPSSNIFAKTEQEQTLAIETLRSLTTLNAVWSKKYLEECNFNFKNALMLFIKLYKQNKIPAEGFIEY